MEEPKLFSAEKQRILKTQQSPSKFLKDLKAVLQTQSLIINAHVDSQKDLVWNTRLIQVRNLLETIQLTENRAIELQKLFGITLYDDSMLYAECVKLFGRFDFWKDFFQNFWQNFGYRANALFLKLEAVLDSAKADPSIIFLNAKIISEMENEAKLKMPEAQRLQIAQDENSLLKQQLLDMNNNLKEMQATQARMQAELQTQKLKTETKFNKLKQEYVQLYKKSEEIKQESDQNRKLAATYSPTFVRPRNVKPLFTTPVDKDMKEIQISKTNHPEALCCPITRSLFEDPVLLTLDGQTYEKKAIIGWIATPVGTTFKSPLNGQEFPKPKNSADVLVQNQIVRTILSEYIATSPRDTNKDSSPGRKGISLTPSPYST